MVKALEPGDPQQVGKYRLLGVLGSGGMGRVYLGRSPGGRLVAVKLIRPELAEDPDFRLRFAREVATARTVSGIFTAPVVDADTGSPQPWLVTAFVDGPSLTDAVAERGPMPPASVLTLAAGLAEGLGAIHAAGVVHRDLKPSNVLLAGDGPRIIDFGISRAIDATELTRAGWVAGSPGFMSPEQAEGGEAGPASDIFSLGGVLAFAATGEEPFGEGAPAALLYRVVHGAPAIGQLPDQLRWLVGCCLAKDPGQRPTTDQLLAELGAAQPAAGWLPWSGFQTADPAAAGRWTGHAPPAPTRTPTEFAHVPGPPPAIPGVGLPTATPHAHSAATWPQPPPGRGAGAQPRRRGPGWAWAISVLAVLIALVAGAVIYRVAGATQAVGSAAVHPKPAASRSRARWTTYLDPSGFSIKLPRRWSVSSRSPEEVQFTGMPSGFVVLVEWTTHPKADQLTDWKQQAAAKAATDPTYRQLGIHRVSYRGDNAADWEFINIYQGVLVHVLDRGFIVRPGHLAYAIELYGPDAEWLSVYERLWKGLVTSFKPA